MIKLSIKSLLIYIIYIIKIILPDIDNDDLTLIPLNILKMTMISISNNDNNKK